MNTFGGVMAATVFGRSYSPAVHDHMPAVLLGLMTSDMERVPVAVVSAAGTVKMGVYATSQEDALQTAVEWANAEAAPIVVVDVEKKP